MLLPGKKPGLVSFAEMGNTLTYSTYYRVLWESLEDLTHWPIYPAAGSIPHCEGYPTPPPASREKEGPGWKIIFIIGFNPQQPLGSPEYHHE